MLREVLPHILSEAADPVLKDVRGVIRIRKLQLRIDLTAGSELRDIARLIAARIVAALRGVIQQRSDQIAIWPDEASYAAAYVLHRLGISRGPDWAFPDFTALRYISDREAAVEVLAQRPDALRHLSTQEIESSAIEAIASSLSISDQLALMRRMTQHHPVRPKMTDVLEQAARFLKSAHWSKIDSVSPRNRLFTLLSKLLQHGTAMREAAILAALLDTLCTHALTPKAASGSGPTKEQLEALLTEVGQRLSLPEVAQAGSDPVVQRDLVALISTIRQKSTSGTSQPILSGRTDKHLPQGPVPSQFAGLALLLPSVLRLGLHDALDPPGLANAIIDLFPEEDQTAVQRDPFISLIQKRESNKKKSELNDILSTRYVAQLRRTCPGLFEDEISSVSTLLLADFAAQLPGLQASSKPYLLREFLHRPGRIEQTEGSLVVDLTDMPLGVVLQMGGHLGPRGPAWPGGPALTILLKGRAS
ncbi:hypothetical protein [Cognatishimia sp. MH4019]|uniref:hypothetical protein n=1 Tax=Cognatishimia sp. MH4019 TaxID=2854030 RepID=UPI001CD1FCD1|nr:hypothetical protein [Cognatishimia sp. MH4019]